MERNELIAIAVVLIVVFAGVFYYLGPKPGSGETLIENSLLVKSGNPVADLQQRLQPEKIRVEDRLFAGNDSRNSMIAIMSAEISRAMALQRKNVTVYAIVQNGENICNGTDCKGAQVIVQVGPCNCVYFPGQQVVVEGDEKFLLDQSVRVGRLIGYALYQKKS